MKAWVGKRQGDNSTYSLMELPQPLPKEGQLLLRVHAVGLNRIDQEPKSAHFSHSDPAPASVPGLEAAGEVVAIHGNVGAFREGDRVMAMVQGGCAEYVRVHHSLAMRVPERLSWEEAASIPVSYLTAHDALITRASLASGETVLIHAVTSGVGLAALQLAKRHGAGFICGSSGSGEKLERTRDVGLDLGLLDPYSGFEEAVHQATGGRGVDVVVDSIGGKLLNETLRATAISGRVIEVGRFGGANAEIDLNLLAARRITLVGVTFRSRTLEEHAAVVKAFLRDHGADLESGILAPIIDQVYPFDSLPEAISRKLRRNQYGKLVLRL